MKKIIWIAIIIIILIIAGIFLFNNKSETSNTETPQTQGAIEESLLEYQNIQTSDDVFNTIDDTLEFLE